MTRSLSRPALTDPRIEREVRQLNELTGILAGTPRRLPVPRIAQVVDLTSVKRFEPGKLGIPYAEPKWDDFKPKEVKKLGSSLPGYKKEHTRAVLTYRLALTEWKVRERKRKTELAELKSAFEADMNERIEAHNARALRIQEGLRHGDPGAVAQYVTSSLTASRFPDWLPLERTVSYRPSMRELSMRIDLPPREALPSTSHFEDVEPQELYLQLLVQLALRSVEECFMAGPQSLVHKVRVYGVAATRGGGEVCLVHVRTNRAAYGDLNLGQLTAREALEQLGADISPNPFGLVPVARPKAA